jgi:hypothetical protein
VQVCAVEGDTVVEADADAGARGVQGSGSLAPSTPWEKELRGGGWIPRDQRRRAGGGAVDLEGSAQ